MNGGVYVPVIYDRRLKCRFKKSSQAGASFQAVTDTLTLRVQAALSSLFPPPPTFLQLCLYLSGNLSGGLPGFSSWSQNLGLGWELPGKNLVGLGRAEAQGRTG